MRNCIDCLGAALYPDVILNNVPTNFGIGVFAKEFGDSSDFINKAIQKGFSFFRIQMIWDSGHNYGDKYLPLLREIARTYQDIALAHPTVHIQLSPFCEHNLPNSDLYLDIVKAIAPKCVMVNSIWKGKVSTKYHNEVHGTTNPVGTTPLNYSYDGLDAFSSKVPMMKIKMHMADNFFLWGPRLNLHADMHDSTRTHPPDAKYIHDLIGLVK